MPSYAPGPGSLVVNCQQTRFHIQEDNASKEIDVKGLSLQVVSENATEASPVPPKAKSKRKSGLIGIDILTNADLRLKTGIHYALVGRNGTGKSTLLRALSEKAVPGIHSSTRIAHLQQTSVDDAVSDDSTRRTVLQTVAEGDSYRNLIAGEAESLSKAMEDANQQFALVRALRKIRHARLGKELDEAQKFAQLRSSARGSEARKVSLELEKRHAESATLMNVADADIDDNTIEEETKAALELYTDLQSELENTKLVDIEARGRQILYGLGFDKSQFGKQFAALSGGWRMRCSLAAALNQTSDLLILDEPTNYLDLLGILWLQRFLATLKDTSPDTTVVLVSHDRDFVNACCSETIVLRNKSLVYFEGNIAAYEKSVRHKFLRMTRLQDAQDKQKIHMEKTIANSIRQGKKTDDQNKLRQAKSRQKKLDERMGMEVSAKGTRFKLNRDMVGWHDSSREQIELPEEEKGVDMSFPEVSDLRFPGSLVSLEKVSFQYPKASKPTIQDANLVIHPGDRIGILGLNGSGKSTLIRLLDSVTPTAGTVTRHPRLKIGYYSQHAIEELQARAGASTTTTALSFLLAQGESCDTDLTEQDARGLLGHMGLKGRIASDVPLAKLSGGQLVRLQLTSILIERPHLLVMDEPTTHLDLPTVRALTHALMEYGGAVVIVSHDRFLIRCVVEGEPVDDPDSEDGEEGNTMSLDDSARRRLVYQIKAAKLLEKEGGVNAWESGLQKRLNKSHEF